MFTMIPSAITMELKYGLLCCTTGEDICTYGQFPLLASTESLLGKLGFELCEHDTTKYDKLILGSLIHACENNDDNDDEDENNSEKLSDILLIALDDVRDLRHRKENKEPNVSRRSKNFKVQTLEKSRAKMLEQQQNKTDDIPEEEDNSQAIRDAWMNMARVINSARLLLFLFSQEQGLEMLSCNNDDEGNGIRNVRKILSKLSDALELLSMSSSEYANDQILTSKDKSRWEQLVQTEAKSRSRNNNKNDDDINESVIELTDDSSVESSPDEQEDDENLLDDLSAKMMENAIDDENPPVTIPNEAIKYKISSPEETESSPEEMEEKQNKLVPDRIFYWNTHLTRVMNNMIATMETNMGTKSVPYLKQAFLIECKNGKFAPREKARLLDKQFSLVVGLHGSKEYQQRKAYLLAIEKLRHRVEHRIRQGRKNHEFEDANLDVYGSCLSGLSLGKNADVDLSLTFSLGVEMKRNFEAGDLTAKKYSRHVTDSVFRIKRKLESSHEFRNIEAVPKARVPVIKGVYLDANNPHSDDGSLHFDICLLNDIAVANSGLIKEYSDIDIRVKSLMIAVKKWTKDNKINSAQDNTLSSYTWINMVIYYLQCIGFVPNLQCPQLMRDCNHEMGWGRSNRRQDNINNLNTAYLKWNGQADRVWQRPQSVDETYASVSLLLYGFFRFYARDFPIHMNLVSIKRGGNVRLPKTMFTDRASLHLCIEDPFETYDSHFPHDLGVPADEAGSMLISKCFYESEKHLRAILLEGDDTRDELWPITVLETESSGKPSRRNRNNTASSKRAEIRDPQMTLVIEVPRKDYKKDAIRKLFQPFADQTNSRIVGFSLVKGGKLVFVDYDSLAAVNAALAAHAKAPLQIQDMVLKVSPKAVAPKQLPKKIPDKADGGNSNNKTTLIVQSVSGAFSEKGVSKLFRPFAEQTKSKLVAVDVVKKKKKAFVEYDSPAAVTAALKEHAQNPLFWNGKPLELSSKQAVSAASKPKTPKKTPDASKPKTPKDPKLSKTARRNQIRQAKYRAGNDPDSASKPIIKPNESIEGQI